MAIHGGFSMVQLRDSGERDPRRTGIWLRCSAKGLGEYLFHVSLSAAGLEHNVHGLEGSTNW
ncbi:hypothetical protein BD779DRAFT_783998 [Infundibulicybe gibba]|nr:hypothetical protein BD779DRAFT_783998 [Infundibulicybe gibba]